MRAWEKAIFQNALKKQQGLVGSLGEEKEILLYLEICSEIHSTSTKVVLLLR